MAKKGLVKRPTVKVPSSIEEMAEFVRQIGENQRSFTDIQAELSQKIETLKAQVAVKITGFQTAIDGLLEGVYFFAEAHRDELTDEGKTKTVKLLTGEVSWRMTPPAVFLRDIEMVIATCKARGLDHFLRVKTEVNKEAMLAEPEEATAIKGVKITQQEEFVVKPSEIQLELTRPIKKDSSKKSS